MAGGTKRLQIELVSDTSQATQAQQTYAAQQKQRIEQLLTAEQLAEKAKAELIRKTNQARVQETVSAAEKVGQAVNKMVTAETAAEIRGSSQRLNAIHLEQSARREAAQSRLKSDQMGLDIWKFKVAESHRETMAAWDKQQEKQGRIADAIGGSVKQVASFAAGMLGLQSAQGIVSVLADHFDRTRQYAAKAADDIYRMRDGVRELQALRGEMGQTGSGVSHLIEMSGKTLQTTAEVQAMEQEGLGVGELAIGKSISKEDFDKAMIAAGKMQSVEGGDAGAYGRLMGQIALQSKGKLSPEEAEGRLNRLFQIQQPGGFRNMSQAAGQYAKLNSLVSNDVYSPEEAMGLASAFSVSNPEEASTRVQQFTRSVMAGRVKARGMAVSSDVDFEKTSDYFKGLGITENDSAVARGKKIASDLAKRQEAAAASGKRFNTHEYLLTHGFGNQEDRESIMDIAGLRNSGRLEKIEAAQDAPLDNGAITRRFDDRVAKDPFFAKRAAQNSELAADMKRGQKTEDVDAVKQAAFAHLKAQGKISGTYEDFRSRQNGTFSSLTDSLFFGEGQTVNMQAQSDLVREARRVGVKTTFGDPTRGERGTGGNQGFAEEGDMKTMIQQIRKAGGNPTGGAAGDIAAAAKDLREATAELKKTVKPAVPAAIPSKPRVGAPR